MQRLIPIFLLLLAFALTNGCATHALWKEADLDTWNEPAPDPNIRLFRSEQKKDFLVVYDEFCERRETIHTRAYFLNPNGNRIKERVRPNFVDANSAKKLLLIPLRNSVTTNSNLEEFYAVVSPDRQSLEIYSGTNVISSAELPVYNDGMGQTRRIALTPLAVVADITIVGGFILLKVWSDGDLSGVH